MKILVFGRNGQVARALAGQGLDFRVKIIELGRTECDITDEAQVCAELKQHEPDLIVNAAAYTAVDLAEDEVDQAFDLNKNAVGYIAQYATVPIVHLSTDYVFDGTANTPYVENDLCVPTGVYGQSKLEGEELLRAITPRHVILRTAWVYSPYGKNFVKTMLSLMKDRDEIRVVDDQEGCPTSAVDIAKAILTIAPLLIDPQFKAFGTYHLVGQHAMTWYEFAREIKRQIFADCTVLPITTAEYPTKAKRPAYSVLSTSKFKDTFDFVMPDWQSSLACCLRELDQAGK